MATEDCRVLIAKKQSRGDDTITVSVISHALNDWVVSTSVNRPLSLGFQNRVT